MTSAFESVVPRSIASAVAIAAAGLLLAASGGEAAAYSSKVNNACRGAYYRFCPSYAVGSSQLRQCMRSAGRNLSKACRDALADAGEAPRSRRR